MSKNRIRIYLVILILFALFSVIAFAIPFERNTVFWMSYAFAAVALAAQLVLQPRALDADGHDVRSKFYGFPLARIAAAYLAVQLVLSLVFMILCQSVEITSWVPLVAYVLILGIAAIGFIAADAVKDEVVRQESVQKANAGAMRALQARAASLAGQCGDAETKKALEKLADALRYADPVSSAATAEAEEKLAALLGELESAALDRRDFAAAAALCARASALLAERNRLCRLGK